MYLFFDAGLLHPACLSRMSLLSNRHPGLEAAPDLILRSPKIFVLGTNCPRYFRNSSLIVEYETPLRSWKRCFDLDATIRLRIGILLLLPGGNRCNSFSVMDTGHVTFPDRAIDTVCP